jgi:D-beta-D-heptose 7-phosphate kinase/D-beta-D-heptose 1-phosphate adenosyltransferase
VSRSVHTVVVVGDALLDVDVVGSVSRICPDAPVPVLDESAVVDRAGGAALAATLAARTCDQVTFVTALGDDEAGATVSALLDEQGVEVVDLGSAGATPEKVRLRSGNQSLLRLDRGGLDGIIGRRQADALAAVNDAAIVLVADYGRGVASQPSLRAALAGRRGPLVWDPHPRGGTPVPGTTVATPNRNELAGYVTDGCAPPPGPDPAPTWAADLARRWPVGAIAVTLGARGALLARAEGPPLVVPTRAVTATDACGAGDAFAATLTTCLAAGAVLPRAVKRATEAATAFVAAGGAAALSRPRCHRPAGRSGSIAEPPTAVPTVVATGGCFDLLHAGHVSLLQAAASLGDRLVVLLNGDRSVTRLKGRGRPVQGQDDRRAVLLALGCVDEVEIFDEDTPERALERLRPDVFVKGGDYAGIDLPEAEVLGRWGGQIAIVPYLDGRSTTRLMEEARRGS